MADVVQYRMERMVDELDDLERRGLFSRREIAEIVKKRRHFEYRIKRPSPLKLDFLAYVDYESRLDALRHLRKKSLIAGTDPDSAPKSKKFLSDKASTRRILTLFSLAVARFKGDIDLWSRYLEFCRHRGHGRMKQALAQVLRFHPKVPGLWIYAAAWEFDHNLNVAASRALMQSGLRACPDSEDLWVEYLRMELTFLNKLKVRKVILGEDEGNLARDSIDAEEKSWKDENKDLFLSLREASENNEELNALEGSENKLDVFREQGSIIFRTIYSGSVEAIPLSMSLHKRFLEILDEVDLLSSEELREEIMSNMKKSFLKVEDYWDWRARLKIQFGKKEGELSKDNILGQVEEAVQVYEEALTILPSAKMFFLYARFWSDVIAPEHGDLPNSGFGNISDHHAEFTSRLLEVYERAAFSGCMTEDLAHQYVSLYLQLGRLNEAKKLAEELCHGDLSGAAKLWVLRASIEMKWATNKSASLNKSDLWALFEILRLAISKVAISEAESLWFMAIKFFSNKKEYFEKLVESFLLSLAKGAGSENNSSVAIALINCHTQRHGIQHAREMYVRILALPRPSLATYRHCIELESNLAVGGDKSALAKARKLYESALSIYKQNVMLWQDYYSLELKAGTSDTANAVYWRARKTIGDKIRIEP